MEQLKEAFVDQDFRDFCYNRVVRSSLDEKIQIAYDYLRSSKSFPHLQPLSSKSHQKAVEFRTIGNCYYRRNDCVQALQYYTKSVAFAPSQSRELAFAYANRSAALLELQRFHECLLDINRALRENYPESSKQKLIDRKSTCIFHFQNAVAQSKMLPGDLGQHLLLGKASVDELIKSLDPDGTEPPAHLKIPPPEIDVKNDMIPNASGKIKVNITPENKISIVATTDINPGEILAVEKPFLSGLMEEFSFTHCSNCFIRTEALIHCPNCSVVMYCSTSCRENAFEKFHRIECEIFSMLSPEDEEVSLMTWAAVRIVLIATKQGEKLDEMMNHPIYKFPLSNKIRRDMTGQFNSQDYLSVYYHGQFSGANKFKDFSSGLSLNPLISVALWMYFLKHSSYFGEGKTQNFEKPLTRRELYVARCFLRSLQCDFRPIKEGFIILSVMEEKPEVRIIGHGVFPFMNLFGHSCEPHVSLFSYENNLVCRAIRPIKAGEQIFDCYNTPYYNSSKPARISSLLENYNFECMCTACISNWPVQEKLAKSFPNVVSNTIVADKFREYTSKFRKLKNGLNFQDISKAETQEFLCDYLSVLDERFKRPFREFIDCVTLLQLSLSTAANFYHIINE